MIFDFDHLDIENKIDKAVWSSTDTIIILSGDVVFSLSLFPERRVNNQEDAQLYDFFNWVGKQPNSSFSRYDVDHHGATLSVTCARKYTAEFISGKDVDPIRYKLRILTRDGIFDDDLKSPTLRVKDITKTGPYIITFDGEVFKIDSLRLRLVRDYIVDHREEGKFLLCQDDNGDITVIKGKRETVITHDKEHPLFVNFPRTLVKAAQTMTENIKE